MADSSINQSETQDGWSTLLGHQDLVKCFRRAIQRNRLASTFLFVGPPGVGKRLFAKRMAQALLCERFAPEEFRSCQSCPSCQQIEAETHPDLIVLRKQEGSSVIKMEQLVGDREDRSKSGFCHSITLRPSQGRHRIAIIDSADDLNVEGANALLKTLEEPPTHSLIILLSSSAQKQLPTIRSRSQIVRFQPLSIKQVEQLLIQESLAESEAQARQAARFSGGSVETATEWFDEEAHQFRSQWLQVLSEPQRLEREGVKLLTDWIQAAGKDNWRKRIAMKNAVHVALAAYRSCLRTTSAAPIDSDEETLAAVERLTENPHLPRAVDSGLAATALERTLIAEQQIGANVNVNAWVDAWVFDLAKLLRGKSLDPAALA